MIESELLVVENESQSVRMKQRLMMNELVDQPRFVVIAMRVIELSDQVSFGSRYYIELRDRQIRISSNRIQKSEESMSEEVDEEWIESRSVERE